MNTRSWPRVSPALQTWAALGPDETGPCPTSRPGDDLTSYLSRNGLASVGGRAQRVRRLRSWSLAARHPEFAFPAQKRIPAAGARVDLWPFGTWSATAFEELLRVKSAHSWWLRRPVVRPAVLAERVRRALPAVHHARRLVETRYFGSDIHSVVITGSYLWAATPRPTVDVAVIVDLGSRTALDHDQDVALPENERWTVGNRTVRGLDLLVVPRAGLDRAPHATAAIGDWRLPNGRALWYDTRQSTVLAAVRQTFRACLTVNGEDLFPAETEDPQAMLALAYYFTQEASQLLNWRAAAAKAANRLWEANLILDRLTASGSTAPARLTYRAGRIAATLSGRADVDAASLALLQGWFTTGPAAVLPQTIERLVRARGTEGFLHRSPDAADVLRELLARARAERWPTLARLAAEPPDRPPAEVAALLGDPWAEHLINEAKGAHGPAWTAEHIDPES